MVDEQQQQENYNFTTNQGYNGESIIKLRLDTLQLLNQIECFLKGQKIVYEVDIQTQAQTEKIIQISLPLANEKGVHAIMSLVQASINSQTVQGNYDWEIWREEIAWCREQIATELFVNYDDWNISPQNIAIIANTVMNMIKPFTTRLVNNEERKSYSNFSEVRTMGSNNQRSTMSKVFG